MNNWTINSHTFEFSWFQPIDRVIKPNFAATHKAMPILLFYPANVAAANKLCNFLAWKFSKMITSEQE